MKIEKPPLHASEVFIRPVARPRRFAVHAFLLVAYAASLASFIACSTAPDSGFLPVVIESPASHSEPKGYGDTRGVSRVYVRAERGKGGRLIVRNSGASYAYPPQEGVVSWYGYDHIGRRTATGKWFNPEAMTAAHKSLPFGSVVRVTRLDTGAEVEVTINDRGPYVEGRIIDVARRPAARLGLIKKGIAPCLVEVLKYPLPETPQPGEHE